MSQEDPRRTISKLKRQIASCLSELSHIQTTAKNAKANPAMYLASLKAMMSSLESYYRTYEEAYNELIVLSEELGQDVKFPGEEDLKSRNIARNVFYEINSVFLTLTEEKVAPESRPSFGDTTTTTIVHDDSSHLPDIQLETYNGEILNWPKWRDAFISIVDDNKILSPIKKFHYLRSILRGPALASISKFQMTEANYPLAWKALEETYNKKRLLATAYLNRVINFKPFQSKPTLESLKLFTTHVSDSISSFELLQIENESKFILFHLAFRLLDPETREHFQIAHKNTEFPSFDVLSTFIKDKCFSMQLSNDTNSTFESSSYSPKRNKIPIKNKSFDKRQQSKSLGNSSLVANQSNSQTITPNQHTNYKGQRDSLPYKCFICHESSHGLLSCKMFCAADVKQRIAWLVDWKGCKSCFSPKHVVDECKSKWNCRWCKQRHNSMICENDTRNSPAPNTNSGTCCTTSETKSKESLHSQVILGTCLAEVLDARGAYQSVRLVVDSASHYSFMTNKCAKRLGFVPNKCNVTITGIGEGNEGIKGFVNCLIKPVNKSAPHLTMKALLLKSITTHLPTVNLPRKLWNEYVKFPLADPKFFESKPIEVLVGADLFSELWLGGAIEIQPNSPKLFPTIFGHVVIGKFSEIAEPTKPNSRGASLIATSQVTMNDLNSNLQRFWEIEEPKPVKQINPDDAYCEDHFIQNYYRLKDGSYGVRLPFRTCPPDLSGIQNIALRRFRNQENRLLKNEELREKYHEFMLEYEQLGHMSVSNNPPSYVIPHHHVSKIDRNKLKIRVVFDGSAQSLNGSLNDYLMVGPKLQTDIRDVLLNFRAHKIALVSDCVKMFRGIWIHPEDRKYQTIYWRFNPYDSLQLYELNTVVYGLTSSPYLANRVVRKIVEDYGSEYAEASKVLLRDIYVDDIVSGSNTMENAKELQQQLIDLLSRGNLKLSKWASNEPELLKNVAESTDNPISIISSDDSSVKILGLQWNPKTDSFGYSLDLPKVQPTKRLILSNVAKIYDPLGFISPLVIKMKKFIQDSWKLGLDWDQLVPNELASQWESILSQLPNISNLNIPRCVRSTVTSSYQIVGFADASEMAYCAALYLRAISSGEIKTFLLTAKTKLAPLKSLTIPRLELSGCFLLAKLYQSISAFQDILDKTNIIPPLFFTDSTIVLGWLRTPSYKLKTFVCNRVCEILQLTSEEQWYHVSSMDNPADLGSRGLLPTELSENNLWWNGPAWLSQPDSEWKLPSLSAIPELPDIKKEKTALISVEQTGKFNSQFIIGIIKSFSSFGRLVRTLAYILRFINNLRKKLNKICGPLKITEIRHAQTFCVRAVQAHEIFQDDLSAKGQAKVLKRFIRLNPFFDPSEILRVGGRLYNASLPYNHKHPILLPADSHFSQMIVDHFHRIYLHPGPSLLQAVVQLEFWIPSLRRLARTRVFKCNRCYRLKGKTFIPRMADLPVSRVQAARAFLKTGLDFAGPFYMKESLRRKSNVTKVYICIFICMATKAIHIEAVTSLSANGFLAALDRFVSLRGLPSDLYSDCGSNFVSAARQLKEWFQWYTSEQTQTHISEKINARQINWHFNPPYAPHFGGIWEAGVKSAKSLLTRTVGDVVLTYEELATLIAKISAVLNSRPISPLSSDPSETEYLSPGHFLVGDIPLAIPEPTYLDVAINRLDRWQLVKRMAQYFWDRWHKEYLSTLQMRNKWTEDQRNLKTGDLVFLKDENQPILHWARGRIVDVKPGADGKVRVATVKTATSSYSRPVAKLVPLFPAEDGEPTQYQPTEGERNRYLQWKRGISQNHQNEDSADSFHVSPQLHSGKE